MNSVRANTSGYFFNYSVVFYFGYAYFAIEKLLVRARKNLLKIA